MRKIKYFIVSVLIVPLLVFSGCCKKITPQAPQRDTVVTVVHDTVSVPIPEIEYVFTGLPTDTVEYDLNGSGATIQRVDHYIKVKVPPDTVLIPTMIYDTVFTNVFHEQPEKVKYIPKTTTFFLWAGWLLAVILMALIVVLFRTK